MGKRGFDPDPVPPMWRPRVASVVELPSLPHPQTEATGRRPPAPTTLTMRNFVVTGCGHSGTGYTAQLLRRCGLSCGHEALFRSWWDAPTDFAGWDGDSSWFAAPHLAALPADTVVFHQVRDPRPVIASYVAGGYFRRFAVEGSLGLHVAKRLLRRRPVGLYANRRYILEHVPEVFEERGEVARAGRFWVAWNRLVEANADGHPYLHYDVADMGPELLGRMLDMIGADTHHRIDEAVASVSSTVNSKPRARKTVSLDELPETVREDVEQSPFVSSARTDSATTRP